MPNTAIPVFQTGAISPRDLARFDSNGLLQTAGGLDGDVFGKGVNPFSITDNAGPALAIHSAATSGQYSSFTIGHDASGNALLTLDSFAGLPDKTIYLRKNGTLYEIPFNVGGIVGPVSSTAGHVAVFNNTTGNLLADSGIVAANIISGPGSTTVGRIAIWNSTTGAVLAQAGDAIADTLTIGTDQNGGLFGPTLISASTTQGWNAIVGETVNNDAPNTGAFPAGVTGYGRLNTNGNQAFGVFGLGEARQSGGGVAVGAEFTVANFTATAPDTNLPPNSAIGTATVVPDGLHVTADQRGTADCAVGIWVNNTSGVYADSCFSTGIYVGHYRGNGLVVEAMPSGTQRGIITRSNGNGPAIEITSTAEPTPFSGILSTVNHLGVVQFSVGFNGILGFQAGLASTSAIAGVASALPAFPAGYLSILVNGVAKKIPYYDP